MVLPYIIWNILNMLFAIITSYSFVSKFFLGRTKFALTFSNIFLSIFHYEANSPFWFIFALICFIAVSPVINIIISNKISGLIAIITLIVLQYFNIVIPESFILREDSIIYYLIGCYVGKHFFSLFQRKASKKASLPAILFFALSIAFLVLKSYNILPDINALNTIVLIVAIFSFWILSDLFIDKIQVKTYMEYSFLIYAMHLNIQAVIIKLLYLFGPKFPFMAVLSFFGTTILTLIAIILFAALIKKYVPKLYGILSGNR